ncbi:hypothetical protein AB0J20_09200 [Micromonospora costi]|uniref:hypothetical protein n=1 Tax=Micromonospora costi TaxID=1530042 RepID=UPI0033FC353E
MSRGRTAGSPATYVVLVAAVALGVAGIVYGEGDDSPGLQAIGAVLVVGAVVLGVRALRRGR